MSSNPQQRTEDIERLLECLEELKGLVWISQPGAEEERGGWEPDDLVMSPDCLTRLAQLDGVIKGLIERLGLTPPARWSSGTMYTGVRFTTMRCKDSKHPEGGNNIDNVVVPDVGWHLSLESLIKSVQLLLEPNSANQGEPAADTETASTPDDFHCESNRFWYQGNHYDLKQKEILIFRKLCECRNRQVPITALRELWDAGDADNHLIQVNISSIRRVLKEATGVEGKEILKGRGSGDGLSYEFNPNAINS